MRDRLIELLHEGGKSIDLREFSIDCKDISVKEFNDALNKFVLGKTADFLLAKGVIVTPCVAMVEQFIKDGKFDRKRTTHNGRTAVVYVDKSKWGSPLIDITEEFYNSGKAMERIQVLKGKREK